MKNIDKIRRKDMSKNIDERVDQLEAAVDPNTVISVGGYSFTPAKLMIAGGILSTVLGGLYGAFEFWKDYQDMKAAIQTYVAPDLSEINKKIAVLEQNSEKSTEYVRDINQGLKSDIRRIEKIVEQVERDNKQTLREVDRDLREIRREVDDKIKKALDNPLAQ
jgi:hypothetical protein